MITNYEELTLEEIEKMSFLDEKELKQLSFAELCIYMESLNKIKKRFQELTKGKE